MEGSCLAHSPGPGGHFCQRDQSRGHGSVPRLAGRLFALVFGLAHFRFLLCINGVTQLVSQLFAARTPGGGRG